MSDLPPIYQLDDALTWRGGQQQVFYLHQGLLALGHDSRVLCRPGSAMHERLEEARLPHYALSMAGGHDLAAAWRIGQTVAADRGILHAHSSHAHDLALWASRLRSVPRVVVSRRVDFPVGRGLLSRRKYRSRRVDRYLAISSAVERELLVAGVEPNRVRRVPSGVDFSRFETVEADWRWKKSLGLKTGELLFGNVAALAPHKDQATLLRAFSRFLADGGEGHLVILGEGELRGSLESLRDELGLGDHVSMPGFLEPILPCVAALDIFVLSSSLEGLGTSILDAMALERPVVATRTGGIPDAVVHEQTGLLAEPEDPESLAAALGRVQRDARLRQEIARGGKKKVEEFDVRQTVELTIEAYREIA